MYNYLNMTGRVVYSSGGNYKVLLKEGVFFAKPLGKFRNENIKILVGDIVDIEINENKVGLKELNIITKLHKRKNEFIRPNISNVDNAIIVTSINEPKLNDYYLDKLITIFQSKYVNPILIFTKSDLGITKDQKNIIDEYFNSGYEILITNNTFSDENRIILEKLTKNKLSVIVGQTGVGKTTLINLINNGFNLKTQEISKALGRGKHTTRHAEIFEIFDKSYVIDTPGFSALGIDDLDKENIFRNFLNFSEFANNCKFTNCSHLSEGGCEVSKNVESERIWKNYRKIVKEKINKKY